MKIKALRSLVPAHTILWIIDAETGTQFDGRENCCMDNSCDRYNVMQIIPAQKPFGAHIKALNVIISDGTPKQIAKEKITENLI